MLVQQLGANSATGKQTNESRIFFKYAFLYRVSQSGKIELEHRTKCCRESRRDFIAKSAVLNASPFEKWVKLSRTYSKQLDSSDDIRIKLDGVYANPPAPIFLLAAFGLLEAVSYAIGTSDAEWPSKIASGQLPIQSVADNGQTNLVRLSCKEDSSCCNERDNQARAPVF